LEASGHDVGRPKFFVFKGRGDDEETIWHRERREKKKTRRRKARRHMEHERG
jgi:hypothetical protein